MAAPLKTHRKPSRNILFICHINGARSQMAEAVMNHFSGGQFRAYSAGLAPIKVLPTSIINTLARRHISSAGLRPKHVDEFIKPGAPRMDMVITMCDHEAGEIFAQWPGQPNCARWVIPKPEGASDAEFQTALEATCDQITRAVQTLLALPADVMSHMAVRQVG